MAATSRELQTALDKFAIQEAIYRYSDAVSRGDWEAFEAVLAPDCEWIEETPVDMRVTGARAIRGHACGPIDKMGYFIQVCRGAVIDLHGDDCSSARTHLHAVGKYETHEFVN